MKLIDEIVEMASDGKRSLADALRKCLVLAFELKNEKLKEWADKELNGFGKDDAIPRYREAVLHSKGNFVGYGGARMTNRPLPLGVLQGDHWDLLTSKLRQPIGAYEVLCASGLNNNPTISWPPDLIHHYQSKFIEGYALSSAWQEVPMSLIIGLCEEVRNRLLRFALEIKEELGHVADKPLELPRERVEAAVVNHIYGGMNVIAGSAREFSQIGAVNIVQGNVDSLATALSTLEIAEPEIHALKEAIKADNDSFGARTKKWLASVGSKLGDTGLKIGADVATAIIKTWLLKYFGNGGGDVSV